MVYAGSVPNPFPGGTGSVCNSFQEEIKIQGEGQLNDGTLIKWISPNFVKATSVTGHDGSALVAGQTVARSLSIIAGTGVHLAIDTIGTNVLANDSRRIVGPWKTRAFVGESSHAAFRRTAAFRGAHDVCIAA
jgi:hypothetical protein